MVRGSHSADGERASRCDICTHRGGKLYATNATHDKGLALRDACFDPVHLQRLLRIGPPLQAAYGIKRSHRIDQLPGVAAAQRENLRAASVAEGEQLRVGGTTAKREEQKRCVHRFGDLTTRCRGTATASRAMRFYLPLIIDERGGKVRPLFADLLADRCAFSGSQRWRSPGCAFCARRGRGTSGPRGS